MNVVLADAAATDLERIGDNLAQASPARALEFIRELRACCEGLADMPERFQLVPRYERLGVRRRVHGDYLIFYRIGSEAVEVLHILHGAMDYERLLFPEMT
jgi:plasmid stabilization system protein ParE